VIGALLGRARPRRALPVLVGALVGLGLALRLGSPPPALAHASLLSESPRDGERLPATPAAIILDFDEPVGIGPDAVRLVDAGGAPIALPPAESAGRQVVQRLPPLADGWYFATWTVISSDGHIVHGAIAFAVGNAPGPPPSLPMSGDLGGLPIAAARALGDLGLVVSLGAAGAVLLLGAAGDRVRRFALGAALLGATGYLAVAAATVVDVGAAARTAPAVVVALLRAALLAAVLASLLGRRWRIGATLVALALVSMVVGGHPGRNPLTAILFLLHLAGAALWLGAAPSVLLVLRDRSLPAGSAEVVVRRFSRWATVTLAVVVGGGALLGLLLTDGLAPGLDGRYLAFLGAKVVLVGLAALLGAATRRRLAHGTPGRRALERVFLVDSGILIGVIVLSAGLTVGPPRPATPLEADVHVGHCTLETATGVVSLTLRPAQVGDNTLYLDNAGAAARLRLELRRGGDPGAIVIEAAPQGSTWTGSGAIPVAGVWDVTVVIGRDEFKEERASCQLRVLP
jgi:copper transport protein